MPFPKQTAWNVSLHLSHDDTRAYARGLADEEQKRTIERHIMTCPDCLNKLRLALRASV
jgi:hypothetical protein